MTLLFNGTWEDTVHPGHFITFNADRKANWLWGYKFSETGEGGIMSTSNKKTCDGFWRLGWGNEVAPAKPDTTCSIIRIELTHIEITPAPYNRTTTSHNLSTCAFSKNYDYLQIEYRSEMRPYARSWTFIFKRKK